MGGVSSQKQKVDTPDKEDDEHKDENGSMFPDIDPIDGTHYQHIDPEDIEVHDPGCRSNIDHETINPLDLALSDGKSTTSTKTCITPGPIDGYTYGSRYGSTDDWDRVVFLLDAFEPLIAGSVDVMEIIPHLVFIEDTETFRVKKSKSPTEAVLLLIKRLKESDEPGKWQIFLEALKAEGYVYIANLLLEQTESDHSTNRRILRLLTPELINRIDPGEFIDHLLAEEVISDADREQIQCEKTNRGNIAASLMLLERVPRRLENWFDIFLGVLKKCGLDDLIENFRVPVVSVESCKVQDKDSYASGGYRTPFHDKPIHNSSSPKLNKHADNHPTEADQHIINLRKENELLSKTLEKLLEDIDNLKKEVKCIKEEMSNTNHRHANQQRHTVMDSAPKDEKSVMSVLIELLSGLGTGLLNSLSLRFAYL